ncbi:hypothetical protein GCM10023186_17000 [Hymenobacter koreensis]|uniref:Uncharacterized protein n=1 Tax=Hymenobacter koreensis TaxID=1084523 RepID=A0ABP8IYV6_9BACT
MQARLRGREVGPAFARETQHLAVAHAHLLAALNGRGAANAAANRAAESTALWRTALLLEHLGLLPPLPPAVAGRLAAVRRTLEHLLRRPS